MAGPCGGGAWSVGVCGSLSGGVAPVAVAELMPRAHGNRGFYSGGKAQKRPLVADASKLCRTEGDSLFLLAKISWAQLPASLIKRLKLHHSFCIK